MCFTQCTYPSGNTYSNTSEAAVRMFGLHRLHLLFFSCSALFSSVRAAHPLWRLASALSQIWERPCLAGGLVALSNNQPSGIAQDLRERASGPQGFLTPGLASIPSVFKGLPSLFLLPQPFPSQGYPCFSCPHRAALVISITLYSLYLPGATHPHYSHRYHSFSAVLSCRPILRFLEGICFLNDVWVIGSACRISCVGTHTGENVFFFFLCKNNTKKFKNVIYAYVKNSSFFFENVWHACNYYALL